MCITERLCCHVHTIVLFQLSRPLAPISIFRLDFEISRSSRSLPLLVLPAMSARLPSVLRPASRGFASTSAARFPPKRLSTRFDLPPTFVRSPLPPFHLAQLTRRPRCMLVGRSRPVLTRCASFLLSSSQAREADLATSLLPSPRRYHREQDGASGAGSGNVLSEVTLPKPDLADLAVLHPVRSPFLSPLSSPC